MPQCAGVFPQEIAPGASLGTSGIRQAPPAWFACFFKAKHVIKQG